MKRARIRIVALVLAGCLAAEPTASVQSPKSNACLPDRQVQGRAALDLGPETLDCFNGQALAARSRQVPGSRGTAIQYRQTGELALAFRHLIPQLLISGESHVDFHAGNTGSTALPSERRRAFSSSMALFQIFESILNREERKKTVELALQIARELDGQSGNAHHKATKRITKSFWQEWHRQTSFLELMIIAKYKALFGYPFLEGHGRPSWNVIDSYPASQHHRNYSLTIQHGDNMEIIIVLKLPSFINLFHNSQSRGYLPSIGDETLPAGYKEDALIPERVREYYTRLEYLNKLAGIGICYLDIELTRSLSQQLWGIYYPRWRENSNFIRTKEKFGTDLDEISHAQRQNSASMPGLNPRYLMGGAA